MRLPRQGRALGVLLLAAATAEAQAYKQVGQLTILVDSSRAFPGGFFVVQLQSRQPLGTLMVSLDGRKYPALFSRSGLRALVPVPLDSPPGPRLLGVELYGRRGRQRVTLEATVALRAYPPRTTAIPPEKRALLKQPQVLRESRRLMLALRTTTPAVLWSAAFVAPVAGAGSGFGGRQSYVGGSLVEQMSDGTFGEYHRGIDYPAPPGTLVQAPAAGTVVFAGALTLLGNALVLDHGQGVMSLLCHLGRVEVRDGDRIEARAALATSGASGIAASPHVHWGVYIHGVAVDPELLAKGLE
jgi:murein DD-endopeptidase MepM/ murein hydrolase activator NlpD